MIKCICINDYGKPKEIPKEKWVKRGEEYAIIHVSKYMLQNGKLGVHLSEIFLDESCFPYESFMMNRFVIDVKDIHKLSELCDACAELSGVNVEDLIEKYVEETIFS